VGRFRPQFIDEAREAKKPFFLYLPFNAPHFPLMAPADLIAKYPRQVQGGWDRLRQERYQRQVQMKLIDAKWPLSPREADTPAWDSLSESMKDRFDYQMAVYAAMIEAIDTAVGTLVKGLESRGLRDNTLIFFMSDNGANAESGPDGRFNGDPPGGPNSDLYLGMNWAALGNTPFRRFKHFTHEGGISSPLIVSWPRSVAANRKGTIEQQPTHVIDVMSTVIAATGAKYPSDFKGHAIHPMEGISLLPALAGRALNRAQPLFWEHEGNRAARSGNWKIVSRFRMTGNSMTSPRIGWNATTWRPSTWMW
jgi:arylsulfatase